MKALNNLAIVAASVGCILLAFGNTLGILGFIPYLFYIYRK